MAGRIELKKLFGLTARGRKPLYLRVDAIDAVYVDDEYRHSLNVVVNGQTYSWPLEDERTANKVLAMLLRAIEGVQDHKSRRDKYFMQEEDDG